MPKNKVIRIKAGIEEKNTQPKEKPIITCFIKTGSFFVLLKAGNFQRICTGWISIRPSSYHGFHGVHGFHGF